MTNMNEDAGSIRQRQSDTTPKTNKMPQSCGNRAKIIGVRATMTNQQWPVYYFALPVTFGYTRIAV